MDTIGSLIDKLITVDMKMWYAQEEFYRIRKMTYVEFLHSYELNDTVGAAKLYEAFRKGIDLNLQRNHLVDLIDLALSQMIEEGKGNVQLKHKTY